MKRRDDHPSTLSLDLPKSISDLNVRKFIEVNSHGRKFDAEIVRDILAIGKIYDRNFNRLNIVKTTKGITSGLTIDCLRLEKLLNSSGEILRDMAGLRARVHKL